MNFDWNWSFDWRERKMKERERERQHFLPMDARTVARFRDRIKGRLFTQTFIHKHTAKGRYLYS